MHEQKPLPVGIPGAQQGDGVIGEHVSGGPADETAEPLLEVV